jgi:hypothetical protein
MLLRQSVKEWIALLTNPQPEKQVPSDQMEVALLEFLDWLASQSDRLVLTFCWALLRAKSPRGWTNATDPIRWLSERGRLHGDLDRHALELAVTLADDADQMSWWPKERWLVADWSRDSQVYKICASHPSRVVRGWAARALGTLYVNCLDAGKVASPLTEILTWLQSLEQVHAGICGPFLEGAEWGMPAGGLAAYTASFDFRTWFLETLRTSSREVDLPHLLTLEFYAHEFFWRDSEAIREMLRMGRRHLALLTATEEPGKIYEMMDLLEEMARSEDPVISRVIHTYLEKREEHAGMEHLEQN